MLQKCIITILLGTLLTMPALAQQPTILPSGGELADKIRTGEIHITDLPEFIVYFINFGILIAGSVSLLFLVIGGYRYIIGGIMQSEREEGKNTIMYAIIGLVLSLLAWSIVNIVQLLVT